MSHEWDPEILQQIKGNLLDAAAFAENYREIVLIAVDGEGTATVMRRVRPDGSNFETLGLLKLVAHDVQQDLQSGWYTKETPPFREDE